MSSTVVVYRDALARLLDYVEADEEHDYNTNPSEAHIVHAIRHLRASLDADMTDWRYEVANGDTVLGFADWLQHRAEADRISPQ